MMDIIEIFDNQLYSQEVSRGRKRGCALQAPGLVTGGDGYTKEELDIIQKNSNIIFPPSVVFFYSQVKELVVRWHIYENKDGKKTDDSAKFKEDKWLKENYLNKGYSWEALKILLSGKLFISTLFNITDTEDLKATGMYDAAGSVGLEKGSLRPIDFNEYAVACMKVENGELKDNVYLYTGFGGFPEALHDMKIGFEKYLELAYKAKCFNYWNLTYCLKEKSPSYELMKRFWPVIFSDIKPELEEFGIKY